MTKPKFADGVGIDYYGKLQQAIEQGIADGWHRAHKHTDTPTADTIKDAVLNYIMLEVCDAFSFED